MKINEYYDLLPLQKGILFHVLENHASKPLYVIQLVVNLDESINIDRLIIAWETVITRHKILKSQICWNNKGIPILGIQEKIDFTLRRLDISSLPEATKEKIRSEYITKDQTQDFQLERAPLFRVSLIKLSSEKYCMLWSVHHLIMGVMHSANIVINELFTIYDNRLNSNNKIKLLPSANYRDVVNILLEKHKGSRSEYWQRLLSGFQGPTSLPIDGMRNKRSHQKCYINFDLSPLLFSQLKKFISNKSQTLNTLILGAWGLILSKLVQSNDVVFGTVRAYPSKIIKGCVGLFINTLPLRLRFHENDTILTYLNQVRKQQNAIRENMYTPLYEIQNTCDIPRGSTLFLSLVDFKYKSNETDEVKRKVSYTVSSNYPLVIEAIALTTHLQIRYHYDTGLFGEEFVKRLFEIFIHALDQMICNPLLCLNELILIPPNDRKLFQQIQTDAPSLLGGVIHHQFHYIAKKYPNCPALYYQEEVLTYQALDYASDGFASYLKKQKLCLSGEIVAVCLSCGFELMIVILGLLKLGCAYLPLDATLPESRLTYILKDSKAVGLLYHHDTMLKIKQCLQNQMPILWKLFVDKAQFQKQIDMPIDNKVQPNALAYVVYTSGSTGVPKGVLIEHNSVVNMAKSHIMDFNITHNDKILQFASVNFDVFAAEWTLALLSGASLLLLPQQHKHVDIRLVECLNNYKITIALFTASALRILPYDPLPHLRLLLCGGESTSKRLVEKWQNKRNFVIAYGVTEATVCSSMNSIQVSENPTSIGTPIRNTQIYIFDQHNNALPWGFWGEICISGIGLARGYISQQAEERFISIQDPIGYQRNIRLYKTGDLGRILADGSLEFLGRKDRQIKVSGYRVEPAEIEGNLMNTGQFRFVIVTQCFIKNVGYILVAYLVLKEPNATINIQKLRKQIQQYLPSYMVPQEFIILDHLPLTTNGKVDESSLPLPINNNKKYRVLLTSSNDNIERIISNIFKDQLNIDNIDVSKNIFDLGANSIIIMSIYNILRNKLKVSLSIIDLFQYPTIRLLVDYLSKTHPIISGSCQKNS